MSVENLKLLLESGVHSSSIRKLRMARPRRTSSNVLSAELRGDTGAPAVSTLEHKVPLQSPPLSLVSLGNQPAVEGNYGNLNSARV